MRCAAARTRCTAGSRSPISTAIMAITTSSSISVNAGRQVERGMTNLGEWGRGPAGNTILRIVIPAGQEGVKGPVASGRKATSRGRFSFMSLSSAARSIRQRRAVEVDVSPAAVAALPDARLLEAGGEGPALVVEALVEADVGDHSDVAHQADVRRRHRRAVVALRPATTEIEVMEPPALDAVSQRLR